MKDSVKKGLVAVGVLVSTTTNSFSAVDVSGVALDTAPVEAIAVIMLGGLGVIWVAKKVVGFLR